MRIIKDLPPQQEPNKFIALDVELFGLNPKQLHRPTSGEFGCLSIAVDPETVYVITDPLHIPVALGRLRDTVSVYHHAKFDITHLRRWADIPPTKKLWDTMLIERIMYGGYYDFFGLEHLARRHLDMRLDKSLQKSFENVTELSQEQIYYAALDASTTLRICNVQRKSMRKSDFNIWAKVDRPALWAYLDFMGFAINVADWESLAKLNMRRRDKIDRALPVNPRSWQQTKPYLTKLGFKGLPNTQEKTLKKFVDKFPDTKAAEEASKILKSKKFSTWANKYGMNFIEHYIEKDIQFDCNMIYCDYDINKAETGRTSASDPPMQGIPKRETLEFRKCFVARPGNKLIIADYSAQEPSIMAYLSQDKKLIEIINSEKDIYIETAREVFGEVITKNDHRRDEMKAVFLGTEYGMTKYGLARQLGISLNEAEILIRKFFRVFPGVASWVMKQKKKKNYVETVLGRRIYLNRYSSQCENNALNGPLQGTAADINKMATAKIHQNWSYPYPFPVVETTHDEIGLDVPEQRAKEIAEFVKYCMVSVAENVCPGIRARVDVSIGDNWGAK